MPPLRPTSPPTLSLTPPATAPRAVTAVMAPSFRPATLPTLDAVARLPVTLTSDSAKAETCPPLPTAPNSPRLAVSLRLMYRWAMR